MASLEQISSALKKAAAAGDEPAARALAKAYKQMAGAAPAAQAASSSSPPPGAVPGSREYADWAAARARGGNALPPVIGSEIPDNQQGYDAALEGVRQADYPQIPTGQFQQKVKDAGVYQPLNPQEIIQNDQLLGFGDEISGLAGALAQGTMGHNPRQSYDALQKLQEARRNLGIEQNGLGGQAASVVGSLTSLGAAAPGVRTIANQTARIPQWLRDVAGSGTTGAILGGVQGFGSADGGVSQRLEGAKSGAEAGGLVGAVAPVVGHVLGNVAGNITQRRAVNAALNNAPAAADLRQASRNLFQAVDNSGITVDTNRFSNFVQNITSQARRDRINERLDPKAFAAYHDLIDALGQVQQSGGRFSLSDLHTLRQIAQAAERSTEGRDAMFAGRIVDGLDGFITAPGNLVHPPNRLGSPAAVTGNDLLTAIHTWGRARRVGLLEQAMEAAHNYPSGAESGLRNQFRSLLTNRRTRNLWTPVERQAMREVIGGPLTVRALRTLGLFRGFFSAGVGGGLGAAFGPIGSAIGTAAGGAAGLAARGITEAATVRAADRAAHIVATPNIPLPRANNIRIPSTLLPLLTSRQGQ